jgi:glycosyltransferase 2 family protein
VQPPAADVAPDPAESGAPDETRPGTPVWRTAVSLVVGLTLLGVLIYYADVDKIHDRMGELGWSSPVVLLPWVVIACLDALGWRCTLPAAAVARVPFASLVLVRMAGEAVNSVTPTAAVGGEPVKAHLLRAWGVSASDSLASIVIAKTALTVSQSLFVVFGVAALCVDWERREVAIGVVALLLLATAGFTFMLVRLQRRRPLSTVWTWARRIAPRSRLLARLEPGAHAIDARLAEFYRMEPQAFWRATGWHLSGWLFGVVEVFLIMRLIGAPVSWLDALVVEALSQPIRAAAVVIPGGIGTQEWGGLALGKLVGMDSGDATTLWLLKRGRELVFDGAGLVYLLRRSGFRLRPEQ